MGQILGMALLLSAVAQAPSADTIARQLGAADAQTVAWGAYNAGVYHRVDAIPRLQQILEPSPVAGLPEERAFVGVVMDALIQLKAQVPARLLVPYLEKRPVQTFVLLSNATDREDVLLELLPRLPGTQWFAAANILFQDRSPGLVDYLARTVKLQLTINVADHENVAFGLGGGAMVAIACGMGQDPPGYPPHAEYRFEAGPHPGFIVLAEGPRYLYYSRTVSTSFQYPVSEVSTADPNDEDRVEYLRAMWPDPARDTFRAHTIETVVWSTNEALSRRIEQLRSLVESRFQLLVDRARRSRSVSSASAASPQIEVHVIDRRSEKRVP